MNSAHGVSPDECVPQEGRVAVPNSLAEQDAARRDVPMASVAQDERSAERDAAREGPTHDSQSVALLGPGKRPRVRAEGEEVGVRFVARRRRSRGEARKRR